MESGAASRKKKKDAAPPRKATSQLAAVILSGAALPPSPFELNCSPTRLKVQYDSRNMAGLSVIGLAAMAGAPPTELQSLIGQFAHEGASYALRAIPIQIGGLRELPTVQRAGLLKAAADVARELRRQTPEPIHWWLAMRFVQHGFVSRGEYVRATVALKASFEFFPHVEQRGDLLIWQPYADRKCAELMQRLERERLRNPFLQKVRLRQVMDWLNLALPLLANMVMQRACAQLGTAVVDTFQGTALRLPPNNSIPQAQRNAAEEVLQVFEAGQGMPLDKLLERWPKHRVAIQQLVEAGQLIESPDSFVFTERQLNALLAKLKLKAEDPVPGVGDIKKLLGLPRKDAEQFRALLMARSEGQ